MPSAKEYTFTELRSFLAEKSRDGYTEQIRELLKKYGTDRLSKVSPSDYSALMQDARALGTPALKSAAITRDDIRRIIEDLKYRKYKKLSGLLDHHYATSAEDLKEEYFESFMRDAQVALDSCLPETPEAGDAGK